MLSPCMSLYIYHENTTEAMTWFSSRLASEPRRCIESLQNKMQKLLPMLHHLQQD